MHALLSRSPLQTLSMASTQRPTRRRSARHAFEDESDAPAIKRTRTEANGNGRAGGSKAAPKKTTTTTTYEEADDSFVFSRGAKSKRAAGKARAKVEEPVPASTTAEAEPVGEKAVPLRRRKNEPAAVAAREEHREEQAVKRRRSARLSGDKEDVGQPQPQPQPQLQHQPEPVRAPKRVKKAAVPAERKKTPGGDEDRMELVGRRTPVANDLHVEKRRDGGVTKIALPFADTPIIRRNKEMRKESGSGHRRSSTGLRGRRASSLIESGQSNAVPHAQVDPRDFYKHIEQSLPEPRRMKQLLTWCGARALPEKPSGDVKDTNAIMAARAIQQELLDDFANKPELSNWFSREDTTPVSIVKKPNPTNIKMAAVLEELEEELKRLEEEKAAWDALTTASLLQLSTSSPAMPPPPLPSKSPRRPKLQPPQPPAAPQIDSSLLDPSQAAILAALHPSSSSNTSTSPNTNPTQTPTPPTSDFTFTTSTALQTRLAHISRSLEPTIDTFADGVHKIEQYRLAAEHVADRVLGGAAKALEERDREAKERAGTSGVGVLDVLSALGAVLGGR
ncbi:uncharacterized protein BDZ99DRAFT_418655 [Mytilinidion resinicola]|uniref:Uncharacterized protein n=1 Tax=Mytilinidion resinicola TaxID=574789 RepID=A0A6A6YJL9_9PEZI|nr:uncharacterized protein BDZ99DRAFT_418655 [Mytilinidion resinicola]KAF2809056.1 hypothetical protein BDZ99DRAFT_418655 [Mytilinidion resinicola]